MTDYDLTNQEQAETYLKNIETEYSYQCLSEKDPAGCHRLGQFFSTIKKDDVKGAQIYKHNCDNYRHGHSCFSYATKKLLGRGTEVDTEEGVKYLEKSCEYGYSRGCSNAGISYISGGRVAKNFSKGIKYLQKACDEGRGEPCSTLGGAYILGKYDLDKDISKGLGLLAQACDLGALSGCIKLSAMYKQGKVVPKNDALALKYAKLAKDIDKLQHGDNSTPAISLGRTS